MYPVTLGFDEALSRIASLLKHGHSAEALVTSVFTLEKLMRRSLRFAILSRGFTSKQTDQLLGRKGFQDLKNLWSVFDKGHRSLPECVGNRDWQHVPKAVEMRNKFVHGQRIYGLKICREYTQHTTKALRKLHTAVCQDYDGDPWSKLQGRRTSRLQWIAIRSRLTTKRHT